MKKIYKVTLKTTNALKDTAEGNNGRYLDLENGIIYILDKDIDYIFKTYNVEVIEYMGLSFERSE